MEGSIFDYKHLKYVAVIALILSLLLLWLIPGKTSEAHGDITAEPTTSEVASQPEPAAMAIGAVQLVGTQHEETEAPTETAEEIIESEPEATEETEVQTPPQPVKEPDYHNRYAGIVPGISDSDRDILVRLVYHESRGIGGEAVVETVLNRMLDDEFPSTVEAVVYQKNQFSPAKGLYTYPINEPDSFALCEEIVEKVLSANYEPILPSYYLYFNNFGAGSDYYEWHGGNVFYGYPT